MTKSDYRVVAQKLRTLAVNRCHACPTTSTTGHDQCDKGCPFLPIIERAAAIEADCV